MRLLYDFLPVLAFFIAYKLYGIYVATAVLMAAVALQSAFYWLQHRRLETMHIVTLGAVWGLGAVTLLLQNPIFIKWKPTLVNWVLALVFLGSQWIGEQNMIKRLLSTQLELPAEIWKRLNLLWVGFFAVSGGANLYVAYNFSEDAWVNFKLFGLIGLTIVFIVAQALYLSRYLSDKP